MEIIFSRHAKRQMKWRRISQKLIEEVISYPDRTENILEERIISEKRINNKKLRVIYKKEDDKIIIITAYIRGG